MDSSLAASLWCLGTVAHFLLTAQWVSRAGGAMTRDERWFRSSVAGTAGLSAVLHLLAATVGLSLAGVLLSLLAGHAVAAWLTARRPSAVEVQPGTDRVTLALELAAVVTLVAMVIQWVILAAPTADVSGTDAAHYHVPNAVNLALGASLFDLPPTPHLYPMGASTLAAWFILPFQTTLLTDLVMVLPFLLLLSSAAWLFRQLTSLSGLAWSTWAMLALFGTPLFRYASLMSADLLFAGAALALAAALLAPIGRRQLRSADIWLIAMSLGLLLGAKTTGAIVGVLLGVPAVITLVIQRVRERPAPAIPAHVWAGAALVMMGAGGIWLLRNWWVWGSPVAPNAMTLFGVQLFAGVPYEATTYNSVLGDLVEKPGYDVWTRGAHYIGVWLGSWYLVAIGLIVLVPIDAVVGWWRGAPRQLLAIRVGSVTIASAMAAVMVWFLIGAPWTSLEWTKGLSLRYALPCLALLPLLAWVAMFPASLPWYRRTPLAAAAGAVVVLGGLAIFGSQSLPEFPAVPALGAVLAALAIIGAWRVLPVARPGVTASVLGVVAIVAVSVGFGVWISLADAYARDIRSAAMTGGSRPWREQLYDAALAREAREGLPCEIEGRRFFVTNRFDEPLALQGPRLTNKVFYAGRDLKVTATVHPKMGPCDYIVTERAIMGTDKGAALHAALNTSGRLVEVTTVSDVVLLAHR